MWSLKNIDKYSVTGNINSSRAIILYNQTLYYFGWLNLRLEILFSLFQVLLCYSFSIFSMIVVYFLVAILMISRRTLEFLRDLLTK